jgi:5-formyltetrahydrofolate cyclo-ligase
VPQAGGVTGAGGEPGAEAKARLRRALRERRAARGDGARAAAGEALAAHAAALGAETIAAFVAVRGEPPTLPLLEALRALGRRVLLPVLREDMDLEWAAFESADTLAPARLGIPEPTGPSLGLDAIRDAGLVLAPALAVDRAGRRLGQGGGSYDRALERVAAPVIAIVFDDEVLDEPIPVESHDRAVAGVLTPQGGLRRLGGEDEPAR